MTEAPQAAPLSPEQEVDQITSDLIIANQALKGWKERQDALKSRLSELWSAGIVPTEFVMHGYTFAWRNGRPGLSVDDEGKLQQAQLRERLIDEGHAVETIGAGFWDTRKVAKPRTRGKGKNPVSAAEIASPGMLDR